MVSGGQGALRALRNLTSLGDGQLLAWCRLEPHLSPVETELSHRLERALDEVRDLTASLRAAQEISDLEEEIVRLEAERDALELEVADLRSSRDTLEMSSE